MKKISLIIWLCILFIQSSTAQTPQICEVLEDKYIKIDAIYIEINDQARARIFNPLNPLSTSYGPWQDVVQAPTPKPVLGPTDANVAAAEALAYNKRNMPLGRRIWRRFDFACIVTGPNDYRIPDKCTNVSGAAAPAAPKVVSKAYFVYRYRSILNPGATVSVPIYEKMSDILTLAEANQLIQDLTTLNMIATGEVVCPEMTILDNELNYINEVDPVIFPEEYVEETTEIIEDSVLLNDESLI